MKLVAQLGLLLPDSVMPDSLDLESNSSLYPDNDFVISRNNDGTDLSRFGDDILDLTPYSTTGPAVFNSVSWSNDNDRSSISTKNISRELRCINFALMYFSPEVMSVGTLRIYWANLRRLAVLAQRTGCTPSNIDQSTAFSQALKEAMSCSSLSVLTGVHRLCTKLIIIQNRFPAFNFTLSTEQLAIVTYFMRISERKTDQTPVIPTRIYSELIVDLNSLIDYFLEHSDALNEFYRKRHQDDLRYGLNKGGIGKLGLSIVGAVFFRQAVNELGLKEYFEKNKIRDNRNIQSHLSRIQLACKWLIHIFSGMRDTECRLLALDSFTKVTIQEESIHVILGYTSKLTGDGYRPTFWLTSLEAEKAFKAAQEIAQITFIQMGIVDETDLNLPLFPSQNLHLAGEAVHYDVPIAKLASDLSATLLKRLDIRIKESDIAELERFDGFRDWRSEEKFQVGNLWPFTTHQARRSLTVYAARSGMVSISSLSLQLKHITLAMTSYYANNSAFAENFVIDEDQKSLIQEFENEQHIAEFLKYEENVINSTSRLFGGEGTRIQAAKDKGELPEFLCDRTETKRRFENGEMTYKETLFGGCTNTENCDKIAFTAITSCLNCAHAVFDEGSAEKLELAADNLVAQKVLYESESPFYKQIELEEVTINKMLARIKQGI